MNKRNTADQTTTRIKLCGMMNPPDVIHAMELEVDFIGFILSDGFRRSIPLGTFCELDGYIMDGKMRGNSVKKVGVFVNEPFEAVTKYYAEALDMIQLHGNEDDAYIKELRNYTDCPIIKAFKIETQEDIKRARESLADYVLLDSGTGTGKVFDHSLIKEMDRHFFLAGGMNADNVAEAIEILHPYAVDASSSLETDGKKDKNKMSSFVKAVRRA